MTEKTESGLEPKQPSGIRTAAVLCIQLMVMGVAVITPGLAILQEYWSGDPLTTALPVTLISTLPTLTTMLGIIVSGSLLGKVKPKYLAIAASAIYVVFGTLPFFVYGSYAFLLVCRAICGIGIGLMNPLANTIILGCYSGSRKDSLIGYGTLMMNGGGMILQTLGGVLAGIGTGARYMFLAHLFGLIALVFAFMLPDPDMYQGEDTAAEPKEVEDAQQGKAKMPASVWVIALLLFFFNMLNYPTMLNCSTFLTDSGIGSESAATIAAMALNCYTIFGMVSSALFGQVFKRIPQWTISLGFLLNAVGIALIVVVGGTAGVCVGMSMLGLGFNLVFPAAFSWCGAVCDPAANAKAVSTIQTMINLASFLSTYWMVLCGIIFGDTVYVPGYIALVYCVIALLVAFFYNPWRGRKTEAAAA